MEIERECAPRNVTWSNEIEKKLNERDLKKISKGIEPKKMQ